MKSITKVFLLGIILCVGLFTACPKRVAIADIEANPSKYSGKSIAIVGTVKESYGVSIPGTNYRGGVYKVDDGTGSMWVVTENTVPAKGSKVGVKGKVQDGVNYNGKNYGLGMREEDRRFADK